MAREEFGRMSRPAAAGPSACGKRLIDVFQAGRSEKDR